MIKTAEAKREYKIGMACAIGCAILWGILPIYWKMLMPINSFVIIFYRIILVGVITLIASLKLYGVSGILMPLREKGLKPRVFLAGVLVSANWSMYIWAVNANYVIQTCIGYYIEPLVVCIFGVILFKEKLNKFKTGALLMAAAAVMVMLVHFGQLPTVALVLAMTFAVYAAIKKAYNLPAILSLLYETMFLVPVAVCFVVYFEATGQGAIAQGQPYQWALLSLAGIFTAVPLSLFAMAANRITLVAMGITEYISPSLTLIIGIFLFKEPFDLVQFISFLIIWIGLVIFTYGEIRESRQNAVGSQKELACEEVSDE